MAIKQENHTIKGMQRDITVSKFSPEFVFDAYNIRLTARDNNTLLSVTNERGTKELVLKDIADNIVTIKGDYIGHCVLNQYLILFTIPSYGYGKIYKLYKEEDFFRVIELYSGPLNLNRNYPIEALGIYETEEVQKVYWTDNLNPIRFINITKVYQDTAIFNLVKPISIAKIDVSKIFGSGNHSSGVIQYALTYYSLYGSETNIFAVSDLNYCSFEQRGASPEETVNCSFNISIPNEYNIRTEYDYIRIYSIHRTSLDAIPTVKVIADINIANLKVGNSGNYELYTDTGTTGYIIDSTLLQYIGGENILAKTLTTKDNTLFAGNITLTKKIIPEDIRSKIKENKVNFSPKYINTSYDLRTTYPYKNQLINSSEAIKGFKARECYRFGLQFQHESGQWSEVVYIGDYTCNLNPILDGVNQGNTIINMAIPIAYIQIPDSVIIRLITNGYIGVRGVCVYPNFNDRNIICQGVVCPTVFNLQDRADNTPFAQSSWFTRPNPVDNSWESEYYTTGIESVPIPEHSISDGEVPYFKHLESIGGYKIDNTGIKKYDISRNEVQTSDKFTIVKTSNDIDYISTNRGSFGIDSGIVTMYSPEIEFDTSIGYLKDADLKFRIVGAVMMSNTLSDISITTSTTGFWPTDTGYIGNPFKNRTSWSALYNKNRSGRCIITAPFWLAQPKVEDEKVDIKLQYLWAVYPWHRSGSLMASGVPEEGKKRLWELKRKVLSNLWISSHSTYFESVYENMSEISPVNIWHSGDSLIKIKAINNPNRDYYTYYGDIDKVITYNSTNHEQVSEKDNSKKANGYAIYTAKVTNRLDNSTSTIFNNFNANNQNAIDYLLHIQSEGSPILGYKAFIKPKDAVGVEPVSMKYKSGPHAVFAFNYINNTLGDNSVVPMQYILPNNGYNKNDQRSNKNLLLWDDYTTSWKQDTITFNNYREQAFLWLGELYRDNVENRFGGNSDEAILNNTWEVASSVIPLSVNSSGYLRIDFTGDTYVQRYDALRTYEYTSEDTNSIVDILSFMCETRINLDGRYDRNRGNISNLTTTPQNFNLLNPIYSQRNNYFNYHTLDYNKFSNDYFPNTIIWSKEKNNSEEIDTWSNLNMLSSLDLDGDKGEIESLNTFNNEIYCFQKKGLSNILFNSRVQIPVSDGVPIEMTNGLKVNGKRYISNTIGCSNKWSITETPLGLYFIDNETNSLYLFNGQIQSLSDKLGFRQWIGENNSHEQWDPINYKNFRTYYDKNNNDVYFINENTCLCYSELLNQFTSFMSYEKVPAMFNIGSEFYSFNKNKLWHNFEGEYNIFYDEFKPFSITVIANQESQYDKIFNNIDFRADTWDNDTLLNNVTFDTLEVWNEYQHTKKGLQLIKNQPSPLKKKFRIWRANIPRADNNHRDRIRNTWAYIKLSMESYNKYKTQFHDLNIYYFI